MSAEIVRHTRNNLSLSVSIGDGRLQIYPLFASCSGEPDYIILKTAFEKNLCCLNEIPGRALVGCLQF
ncbi:hypothetical protein Tchar_02227 [Tepidimonas charontis]|uniref:Uncharacterized protein n=1 Tax=Tepidimonas charontis TaxID=2267262 RepID=A0A554X7R5_9BURK|nr:hypothetical protein Tchar_02227 [Tepidimonas charontis]